MNSLWTRRSIRVFFLVGFGVPWIGWSIIAFGGVPPSSLRTALFYTGDFMTIGGLVATYVAGGKPALRHLLARCIRGAGIGWWAFALFLPLAWQLGARILYGLLHGGVGEFHPFGIAAYVAPAALMALTTGPLGEEAGWRGFFLPRLLGRYSPLVASVILGVIWGIWHVPLYVHSVFAQVDTGVSFVTSTVCFSIIMTCLFFHTRGSVLLAILFHWTVNISPQAANQMLPRHVAAVGAWGTMWNTGFVVVATLIVMAIAGPVALRRNGAFDAARDLAGEGVENDLAH